METSEGRELLLKGKAQYTSPTCLDSMFDKKEEIYIITVQKNISSELVSTRRSIVLFLPLQ